ncbi:Small glutamine-rich tetratricopeptide repeat-containing protein 2 [Vanrija albida]|uniref:Small glutamine-rich tetratricopeptide repeat-containing protein 2 n=1 Tax=Vanrija albida TaxID=181172 RepID=A0ABR3Q9R0_9TREE
MADARKKQLAFNIIDFLRTSSEDGTVKEDDKESMEVAIQCIAESFGVDPDSTEDQAAYSIKPASLLNLLDVLAKTRSKTTGAAAAPAPAAAAASSAPSGDDKQKAEALKAEGNALMSKKQHQAAIDKYTEAIKLDPNPVFYSNRAAAWGALGKHEQAAEDAERAIDLDPSFSKGYSRLAHAQFSLGNYQKAVDAYEDGLKIDPSNANMKASLATAKTRLAEQAPSSSDLRDAAPSAGAGAGGMPDLSSLASMLGGAGGGGGGGMPDIAAMMRNPQMMAMAQQMMSNGGLERLMANPQLRQMAENMQGGGGMPDFNALASDPAMRDLAQQFMGGGGQGR